MSLSIQHAITKKIQNKQEHGISITAISLGEQDKEKSRHYNILRYANIYTTNLSRKNLWKASNKILAPKSIKTPYNKFWSGTQVNHNQSNREKSQRRNIVGNAASYKITGYMLKESEWHRLQNHHLNSSNAFVVIKLWILILPKVN